MDRRSFVLGASCLASPLCGLGLPSRALASGRPGARVAIIIDDVGYSFAALRPFLDLELPLGFAVLPRLPMTGELAGIVHERGHELMLHQPMEPYDREVDPGRGALRVADSAARIARITRENISQLPFAIGVNNHMGSRFTAHAGATTCALEAVKREGLFFLDSVTSGRSRAYRTARALDMPTARRDVFLDNLRDEAAVLGQLRGLARLAAARGSAIGIGHPYPETAAAIGRFASELRRSDVSLVAVSGLVGKLAHGGRTAHRSELAESDPLPGSPPWAPRQPPR